MAEVADIEFVNVGSWGNGAGVFAQISLGEKAAPGTAKNLLDAVCTALPAGTCAIVAVPPLPPFGTHSPEEVLEAVRKGVPVGSVLSVCHADGRQKTERTGDGHHG